jgi:hypothetical protein
MSASLSRRGPGTLWVGIALALAGSVLACGPDRRGGDLHAALVAKEREAEGLRESVAKMERGEPILPEDAVIVAVSEAVVKEFLGAQLPFEADAGPFHVTLQKGTATFNGSAGVHLTGTIAPIEHPDLVGELGAIGALEDVRVDAASGTLTAKIAVDHVELVRIAGLEGFIGGASLDELARTARKQIEGHLPHLEIPVKIEQAVELPSVTDGPVRIEGARMPLEVAVTDVYAGSGYLWLAVRVVPGELKKIADAPSPAASEPPR